jgi:TatD DNase family protein
VRDDKPIDLPDLGGPVVDTHAHLVMLDDPAGALERAAMASVTRILTIVDATEAPLGTFQNLDGWIDEAAGRLKDWDVGATPPAVSIVIGTHPHNAKDHSDAVEAFVAQHGSDPRVVAIGEIGLDYHYDYSPRSDQRRAFRAQLALAKRLGLPAVVHLREADDEGFAILEEVGLPDAGCVIHCFTGDAETVRRYLDLGCHVSFAGPVTFTKGDAVREAAAVVPLDRLLVETDCPFMAPVPYRGRTNEPAWVVLTAARIAEIKGVESRQVAEAVLANAAHIFGEGA